MKKSRAEWQRELERQESSGLSLSAYAKQAGLSVSTLQYWRRKLKEEGGSKREFIELSSSSLGVSRGEIELELPHGIVLRVRGQ